MCFPISRIDSSLAAYRANLDAVFVRVQEAAPKAKLLFLQTYNPFAFGFQGIRFEDDSSRIIGELNKIGAEIARRHGALVGDGFTPMQGRAGSMTHMAEATPDIHPLANGYDALAAALLDAK